MRKTSPTPPVYPLPSPPALTRRPLLAVPSDPRTAHENCDPMYYRPPDAPAEVTQHEVLRGITSAIKGKYYRPKKNDFFAIPVNSNFLRRALHVLMRPSPAVGPKLV